MVKVMNNILTFDLEDWYHGNFLDSDNNQADPVDRVIEPTLKIIKILKDTSNKATFFVLGSVADKYPELIKKIYQEGHEIASHSFEHKLIYNLGRDKFAADVKKSVNILENIIGEKIYGYRAPYWSLYLQTDWAWDVLQKNGLLYDSSLYPYKTYLYGDNSIPRFKYDLNNYSLFEIPPSILKVLEIRIPFCGGFYFRVLPYWFVKWGINRINKLDKQPAVFYLHPYEIDIEKPKSSHGFKNNFILHANIKKTEQKLLNLLMDFKFVSIKDYYNLKLK
ncbi:MAG: polysaccharide deacetylase family protein [Candidatus Hodarchaeota archaeon]